MKIKKINEFGLIRRTILRLIHKAQKSIIGWENTNLYYLLARAHFAVWFNASLKDNLNNAYGTLAARRHARIVLNTLFANIEDKEKRRKIFKAAQQAFLDNLIIETEL